MNNYLKIFFLLLVPVLILACSNSTSAEEVNFVKAFPHLKFREPVFLTHNNTDKYIFVLERRGRVLFFENNPDVQEPLILLDISEKISLNGWEEGLLGLAFHPDFPKNGKFYINYTAANPKRTVISSFTANPHKLQKINASTAKTILEFKQPYSNHNGGMLAFGPDNYLYIGIGDGGSGGDPHNNGQNRKTLLGAVLRLDIDHNSKYGNYAIPPDNPFYQNQKGYREEIWAYGLRNPWRFSFDTKNNNLWLADVGQNKYEEIDLINKGGNYGWNIMEGFHCYRNNCRQDNLILPLVEYDHSQGNSVTGGYVYQGKSLKDLHGYYIYGDFGKGTIWKLKYQNKQVTEKQILAKTSFQISSFGEDYDRELYLIDFFKGDIYKFTNKP